jgi:hypothetical protein
MMRERSGLGSLALAVCCVMAYAGEKDFWITKPYTQWNAREVEKLLNNSPWSKSVTISLGMMTGGRGEGGGGAAGMGDDSDGGGMGGGTRRVARNTPDGSITARTGELIITWYSQIVRHAMARSITLRNPDPPKEELDKILNYPETPYFNILVIGWMGDARANREDVLQKLKASTFLEKKSKEKIQVADVMLPVGRGKPLALLFPKQNSGKPTLTLEDKEVTLQLTVVQNTVRAKFKLEEMVVDGAPSF